MQHSTLKGKHKNSGKSVQDFKKMESENSIVCPLSFSVHLKYGVEELYR